MEILGPSQKDSGVVAMSQGQPTRAFHEQLKRMDSLLDRNPQIDERVGIGARAMRFGVSALAATAAITAQTVPMTTERAAFDFAR